MKHTELDHEVGRDDGLPGLGRVVAVTLSKDHPNVATCQHCGEFLMFRWGRHGFRAYVAVEQVRTVRSTGTRSHWARCNHHRKETAERVAFVNQALATAESDADTAHREAIEHYLAEQKGDTT